MNMEEAIRSINESIDQIVGIAEGLPEELIRWKPQSDTWSIAEILCHVEEATPYWLQEIQALVASPGTEWGRGLQHAGRLEAVASAGKRSTAEVRQAIQHSKKNVRDILSSLSEVDLRSESPSRNPRFGTKPLAFIVEHLLLDHLDAHLRQIKRNMQQFEAAFPNKR
ncbi:DinB family protein [Brevibacillus centrosporus]|uniref:DinB family protein n=1 Tax=Brevibacillus centrosporus TaxID=54910 RepID=UPI002E21CDF7|nr:DinB family protein [Brevibacillus centrosporus]